MEEMTHGQRISFEMIASAGDARSFAFAALQKAKCGCFEEADGLMEQSREAIAKAHHSQNALLRDELAGEKQEVDILQVHAQDHLMTAMLAQELIAEMIEMYRKGFGKENA